MVKTPHGNRLHVGIFGETNAGKSALFNALTNSDISIVSEEEGTTTDAVQKAMELLPFGPVVLIDTAGLNDKSSLGQKRLEKTKKIIDRIDIALYVIDASKAKESLKLYKEFDSMLKDRGIPHVLAISKVDEVTGETVIDELPHGINVSVYKPGTISNLKESMIQQLTLIRNDESTLVGNLIPAGSHVVMVVTLDSGAPRGRLILPQVQLVRDCLDNNCFVHVSTEKELGTLLENLKQVDLVVTDSQVFNEVAKIIPKDLKLTSFSILLAHQKGEIATLIDGIKGIGQLKDGDKVLISEVCTHSKTHDDIGQVKIPEALKKLTGKDLKLEFTQGRDYPSDLSTYNLVIHCAGCMVTPTEMKNRIKIAKDAGVPITNYGLFLAYVAGVLDRSIEILGEKS